MNQTQQETYNSLLSSGRGCEAAYYAAHEAGETPMGVDNESAIGRAAAGGLRHRNEGKPYAFAYADYQHQRSPFRSV